MNARLLQQEKTGVTLLPSAAIQRNTNDTYVYLIKPDNTVTVRNITVGTTEGDQSEITSGLSPGDNVVMTGVDKLQEGSKVVGHHRWPDGKPRADEASEPVADLHSPARRHVAADGRHSAGRYCGVPATARFGAAGSRLSDHSDRDVLPRRQSGRDGLIRTAPLERQFGQVPGLQQMTSVSSDGSSVITLQFNLSLDIDIAEQEVQQSINASGTYLPADLPTPPIYSKTNPADAPVLTLALTSQDIPLSQVEDLADTRLAPKISQLPGVGLVSISGGQKPAVRIQANPTQLASYGLNLEDLRTALVAANVNQAKGNFDGPHQSYQIGANDQLLSSADYAGLVVAYQERRAGQTDRRCQCQRRRRKCAPGRVDEPGSRGDPEHSAAAGGEHHLGSGPDPETAAATHQHAAGFGPRQHAHGSDHDYPRFREGRGILS